MQRHPSEYEEQDHERPFDAFDLVDRALLKDPGDDPEGMLTTQSRAICRNCGAGHPGEHPEHCHVCGSGLGGSILVHNLYRIENVGTYPAERITSNDEDRQRQGFEIQTTFSFEGDGAVSRQAVRDSGGEIATLEFAPAALISRINKGLRRRKDKAKVGFFINLESGVWTGEKKENGGDGANRPDVLQQLVVPLVEDRKNALLLRFPRRWLPQLGSGGRTTLTTIQHALARGIEAVFQLEEGEILVEPVPSADERNALLFYESAEGGAGALAQLVSRERGFPQVARRALGIMHYDSANPPKGNDAGAGLPEAGEAECVAGCYRCILSYFNQPDHEHIDRRDAAALSFLVRLAHAHPTAARETRASESPGGIPRPDDEPLVVDGTAFPNVWHHARLVVADEGEAEQGIAEKLAAKGVTLMERPGDPALRTAFEDELAGFLKDRA